MSISRRKRRFLSGASFNAEVAELADAHGSGPCTRKGVGVRVPSSAPVSLQTFKAHPNETELNEKELTMPLNRWVKLPNE
jgi:hypothetical protein